MPPQPNAFILSVPVTETTNPTIGLEDILHVIGVKYVSDLVWGVERLECTGLTAQDFLAEVEGSPKQRILIPGQRFLNLASAFEQVIEGVCVGYVSPTEANEFLEKGWTSNRFSTSLAQIAIKAVDGCWFDVYVRARTYGDELVKRFRDVRWNNPTDFLV